MREGKRFSVINISVWFAAFIPVMMWSGFAALFNDSGAALSTIFTPVYTISGLLSLIILITSIVTLIIFSAIKPGTLIAFDKWFRVISITWYVYIPVSWIVYCFTVFKV